MAKVLARRRAEGGKRTGDQEWFDAQLDLLVADVRAHGVPLVVYGLAPHVLANPDPATCGQAVRPAGFCESELQAIRRLHRRAWQRGVPFVSSVPWLRGGEATAYFRDEAPDDVHHPNAEGHRRFALGLADLVARWLDGEGLLSEPEPGSAEPRKSRQARSRREAEEAETAPGQ